MLATLFEKLQKQSLVLLLCLTGCTIYAVFFLNAATVNLSMHVEKRTIFQMYWAEANKGFSEKNSAKLVVGPRQKHYQFSLTNLRNVGRIRLDPHKYIGGSIIEKITIEQVEI